MFTLSPLWWQGERGKSVDNDLLRNGSGYVDYTAYRAMTNIQKGERTMRAGEIWEVETNNGYTKEVVILAPHDGYCTVLALTDYDDGYPVISRGQKYTDVGRVSYCFNDTFTKFIKLMPDKDFGDLMAEVAKALGIEQKTVEVPVEKVVEVHAPVQYSDDFRDDIAAAKAEAKVYKDLYEKLLAKVMG